MLFSFLHKNQIRASSTTAQAAGAYIGFSKISGLKAYRKRLMAGLLRFSNLAPKTKNIVLAGGLTSFVFGVYFYTMRAVGGTDELQIAIEKLEVEKGKSEAEASLASKA